MLVLQHSPTEQKTLVSEVKQARQCAQQQREYGTDGRSEMICVVLRREGPSLPQLSQEWSLGIVVLVCGLFAIQVLAQDG